MIWAGRRWRKCEPTMAMKTDYAIKSSKQALTKARELKSVWSDESRLTQRILIYACQLLEKQLKRTRVMKGAKLKRFSQK